MISEICNSFANDVEGLDPKDEDYPADLRRLVLMLVRDASLYFADYGMGEIPALCQRCHEVLSWLSAEAEDPEDRQRRYGRQQVVLNLLTLCEALVRFHDASGTRKAKAADLAALRAQVADALQGLVAAERTE
jgi:hypothetical protein